MKNNKNNNKNNNTAKSGTVGKRGRGSVEKASSFGHRRGPLVVEAGRRAVEVQGRADTRVEGGDRGLCETGPPVTLGDRGAAAASGGETVVPQRGTRSGAGDILGTAYEVGIRENFCKIFTKQFSEIFIKNVKDEIVLNIGYRSIDFCDPLPGRAVSRSEANATVQEPPTADSFIEKFTKKFIKKFSVKLSEQFVKKFIKKYSSIRKRGLGSA